ncbi:MAG: ABC transporter ATP-binding protein [Chitinispirillales bacterium]|jgi:ABC-2 type transport system ATP-binding protein|nr:ABC transporter ATP-binding protein [Chitinispirillales bacterium]
MIELVKVIKRYGRSYALDSVSLKVSPGEAFALLGPNGAGKTSIIRILLGFTKADAGVAKVNSISVKSKHSRVGVGYLPEVVRFPGHLDAPAFLRRTAALKCKGTDINAQIMPLLEKTGLGGKEKQKIGSYSKGMMQRLGLASALLCGTRLLILDEPTAGLDPIRTRELRLILQELKDRGITILVNSHMLSEVERLCDSAAILNRGKVLAAGRLTEIIGKDESLEDAFIKYVNSDRSRGEGS